MNDLIVQKKEKKHQAKSIIERESFKELLHSKGYISISKFDFTLIFIEGVFDILL